MSKKTPANPDSARPLPERANLEHLRKEAKQRLKVMRLDKPGATLAAAQLATAGQYGFTSWRRLVAHVKAGNKPPILSGNSSQAFLDGLEAERRSDYQAAAAHFRQAIAEQPAIIPPHYRLGRALIQQQLYSEALDAFEGLLKIDPQNLPAHYEIGKLHLAAGNYADAVAKYRWLKSQAENPKSDPPEPYDPLPEKPRHGDLAQNPLHRVSAVELARFLLELVPHEVAEQHQLPASRIVFGVPERNLPFEKMRADLQPTILYRAAPQYTEIARINRIQGEVLISLVYLATGLITNIRVIRYLPDGLTQCAINATQQIRFQPAVKDGMPVSVYGEIEFNFNLEPESTTPESMTTKVRARPRALLKESRVVSESGKKVILRAIEVSRIRFLNDLAVEHIFIALSDVERELFNETMQSIGLDPCIVTRMLELELGKAREDPGKRMMTSDTTQDSFNRALGRARQQGRQKIESFDLFVTLFADPTGVPAEILRCLGADPAAAAETISQNTRSHEER